MDPNNLKNPDSNSSNDQNPLAIVPASPIATASLSVSLSTILPIHFLTNPKLSFLFSHQPNKVKILSQATSLSHLSISPTPPKISFKSTIATNHLQNLLPFGSRRPSYPSIAAGLHRASVVWFRNDLRTHDNECLNSANNESISVLPVYCFNPKDYGKSASGFDKTGSYRTTFLIESVSDLRKNLQSRGSDLVVRVGEPETVLVELAKAIGAAAVYSHREVSHDEVKTEEIIEAAMMEEGVEVKYFWGSTLYHVDDLPFTLEDMPTNYGEFMEKVKGLEVRKTIAALDQLKDKPARGDVERGDIPTLSDLGLTPATTLAQDGFPAASASMVGGETEALRKLKKFAAECQEPSHVGTGNGTNNVCGANFSCNVSPWLTIGCISPRTLFDELKKTASKTISVALNRNNGGNGSDATTNWLMDELLWRDFFRTKLCYFRYVTKKCSSGRKQLDAAPITGCMGALAEA